MGSPLGPGDLVITSSTLGNPPFAELVAAAAGAGFAGLSLWPAHDFSAAIERGQTAAGMRAMLDEAGLVANDVDAVVAWSGPDDPGPQYFEEPSRQVLFETADALGASVANVLLIGPKGVDLDDIAATFAGVCDEAAQHGMQATIEFSLRTQVPDVTTAARVVELAGRPNGAVLIDTWHFHYGLSTLDGLGALKGASIGGIQVNDGPSERPEDYGFATRYRRLPPGEGDFDLGGMVSTLDRIGYPGPLTVEVFNEPMLTAVGPGAFAGRVFDGLQGILDANRQ